LTKQKGDDIMSLLSFLFKSKKEMAKENTKHVKVGKYELSSHAQNRIVDNTRDLKKKDMLINLFGKSSKNSKVYYHRSGTKQYDRVSERNRTLTHIVDKTNVVKSIQRFHDTPKARREAYRYFK